MERTCICTLSFGAVVSRLAVACALDPAYVMLLLIMLIEEANTVTLQTHSDELSSSLVSVLSYLKYKFCVLHCCLVQNHLLATAKQCIQDSHFLLVPVKPCHLDGAPGCFLVRCINSTCKCILPDPAHPLKLRCSITRRLLNVLNKTQGTSVQVKNYSVTRHLMPNSFHSQLTLKSIFIPTILGLPCNEQDCGTEALKLQDTLYQLNTCGVTRNRTPDSFAELAHGLPTLDSFNVNILVDEENSDEKSPSRGSLFNWLSNSKIANKLRNIRFKKLFPSGVRFKLAFFSIILCIFLLLSALTCAKFVTNSKKHPRETSVFIIVVCSLQLAEAMPYNSHMEILNLGTREATNGISVVPLKGSPNTGYCVMIGIGSENKQEFCVLLDTGSANLAIAGRQHPDINSQFHPEEDLGKTVQVSYTAGSWTGRLAKDSISIGDSNPVESFLVVIESAEDFYIKNADWVGIMGLAYSNLAKPDSSVTPFWEAFQAATGKADVFSFRFCPPLDIPLLDITEPKGGDMVLGGIDETLYNGPIFYTSLVQQKFYNVLVTNITVGGTVISLDCGEFNNDQSIVDSGTTDVFLPQKVFTEVKKAFIDNFKDDLPIHIPEEFWNGGYKLAWTVDDKHSIYSAFPTFYISFATHDDASLEFSLAVTPQIYLRQIDGTSEEQASTNCFPECDFFTFGIKQRQQGTVIGGNIMLGFYTIFDRENKKIGFAQSTCEYQDDLGGLPHIVGPYMREPIDCECAGCKQGQSYWEITTYVCGVIVIPLAITSVIFAVIRRMKRSRCCYSKGVSISRCREKCCGDCCNNSKLSILETDTLLEEEDTETNAEGACSFESPVPETGEDKKKHPQSVEEGNPAELEEREDTQLCLRNELEDCASMAADCQEQHRTSTDLDLKMRNTSPISTLKLTAGESSAIESYGAVNMPTQETDHSCTSATVYTSKGKNVLKSKSDTENEVLNTSKQLEKEMVAHELKKGMEYTPLLVRDSGNECMQPEELEPQDCTVVSIEEMNPSDSCSMLTDPKPIHSRELEYLTQECRQAVVMERQESGPHPHDSDGYGRQVSNSCSLAADSGNLSTQTSCEENLH